MPVPSLDCFWSFSVLLLRLPTFPYHTTNAYSVTWSSKHLCAKNWMWSNVAEISSLISTSSAWYTSFGFGYCTLGSIYIQLTFVIVWTQNWWKINQILLLCDFNLRWFTLEWPSIISSTTFVLIYVCWYMHIKYQMRNFNQDLAEGRYCKTGNILLSYQDTNFTSNWEILAKLLGQQICQKCIKFVLLFTFMKHENVLPQLIKMNTM